MRRARWAVTDRRRFRASTGCGCCGGPRVETSRCAASWLSGRARAEGRLPLGLGVCACREAELQKSVAAGERDRPDVARRRAQWIGYQNRVDAERLVFIDETWARTDMAPLRGWAPRGDRLCAKVPHGHWKTTTFLAALRHDRIVAPWLVEGPINDESFCASKSAASAWKLHDVIFSHFPFSRIAQLPLFFRCFSKLSLIAA